MRSCSRGIRLVCSVVLAAASIVAAVSAGSRHGVDVAAMDGSVAPGQDFFRYANGHWLDTTEIPSDRSIWGVFDVLGATATERTRVLLEAAAHAGAAASAPEKKAGDYYAALLDEPAIEARGTRPLAPALARIQAIDSQTALARALGDDLRADVDPLNATDFHTTRLFGLWVSPGLHDTSRNQPYLLQGGLDMPDREYYVSDSPKMAAVREAFGRHVVTVLRLGGVSDPEAKARDVVALETAMARVHASRLESLDVRGADNPWPRAEYPVRAPGLDWDAFFTAARLNRETVVVAWHPRAIAGLAALAASEPLDSWKAWLAFHTIERMANVLPSEFVHASFDFHGRTLAGTPELAVHWKRAVALTDAALGDAVGQLYVRNYFPPETRAHLDAMVTRVAEAFGRRVDALDWMAASTKAKAREKLGTLYVGVGYPERWIDYAALEVRRDDAFGNAERASLFEYGRALAKLGAPVDRHEWWMTPQTVNAVNVPLQNALNFPAAILEAPFYDPQATDAVNYGAIGAVIGHEISHSFDDQGAMFDARGALSNWWTPEDLKHFDASGAALAAQFDRYAPFPDLHVNGRQTLSENIADLAGLSAAYDAWRASLAGTEAPRVDGLTGDQQFFLGNAQIWRTKAREPILRQIVVTNGHAPGQYRAATVRNLDAWYAAFDVRPGQALFLSPGERVRVW